MSMKQAPGWDPQDYYQLLRENRLSVRQNSYNSIVWELKNNNNAIFLWALIIITAIK